MTENIVLPNGVRIVYERLSHVRSAAIGIWVACGTRHEQSVTNGISHFIEHMVFKGTKTRTARQIAEEMDEIGGAINAFTAMQCTCFYAQALDTHILRAADVLCDLYFDAAFRPEDIELERGVISEEINMYLDSPEDLVCDQMLEAVYSDTPLGRPILGTKESISRIDQAALCCFRAKNYTAGATVVSVSGSFDDSLIEALKARFSAMPAAAAPRSARAEYRRAVTCYSKETEQNHLCIAFPAFSYYSEKRYALQMLNSILGGSMSSRLFQRVREEAGLCYSISSFSSCYEDTGLFSIYTALGRETERAALQLIREELCRVKDGDVTERELARAREQHKANLLMGMESTGKRMTHQAHCMLRYNQLPDIDALIAATDAVTCEDITALAQELFRFQNASFSGVGTLQPKKYLWFFEE